MKLNDKVIAAVETKKVNAGCIGTIVHIFSDRDIIRVRWDNGYDSREDIDVFDIEIAGENVVQQASQIRLEHNKAKISGKERIENEWQEALKTGFGMKWRVVRSQKSAVGKPNETFWKYWKSKKNALLAMGIRVSKNAWGWEVEIPTGGDESHRDHIQFGTHKIYFSQLEGTPKPDDSDAEVMRDDLEKGLHSPNAASELRAETPDEYDARRDAEEDGIGEIGRT